MSAAVAATGGEAANVVARRLVLTLTLVLCCATGLITPYLLAVIGILVFAVMLVRGSLLAAYRDDLAARGLLLAFVVLGVCFALTARAPQDVIYVLNFVMLALYPAFATLLRGGASRSRPREVANLALAGTFVAFAAAALGAFVFNWPRAESPIFGAILLANTAFILGFVALLGIVAERRWVWLYALGPVLGVVVIALTGSRGPLLAVVPVTLVAAWFMWREVRLPPLRVALGVVAYLAFALAIVLLLQSRSGTIFAVIGGVFDDPLRTGDSGTSIRLALYEAGFEAFRQSVVLGHGWANLMGAALPFVAPGYEFFVKTLPHLHSDIVDFAVAAGLVGVTVYVIILATPLVAALRSADDGLRHARLYGCLVLCTAYFFDGLTDLMFGMEFHGAFFVVLAAIFLAYCRAPDPP